MFSLTRSSATQRNVPTQVNPRPSGQGLDPPRRYWGPLTEQDADGMSFAAGSFTWNMTSERVLLHAFPRAHGTRRARPMGSSVKSNPHLACISVSKQASDADSHTLAARRQWFAAVTDCHRERETASLYSGQRGPPAREGRPHLDRKETTAAWRRQGLLSQSH